MRMIRSLTGAMTPYVRRMRIAVVGTGIAGLGAAHAWTRAHEVEVFEREARVGGHTNTVDVRGGEDRLALDTGFIVHNAVNYPRLLALFAELGVRDAGLRDVASRCRCARCGLEYSRRPWPLARRARLLGEIVRFLRTAERGHRPRRARRRRRSARFVAAERYSERFATTTWCRCAPRIWSTPPDAALDFPARYASRSSPTTACSGSGASGGAP